ncbi:MAG TPA: Nramp family divalent metal transporter [Opitutaceae bacterium]|jgi:manganese transport protein|nr:Nramp family divalent metal transporter [Opitutaceae bacterium]
MDSGPTAPPQARSLEEAHRSIAIPAGATFWRKLVAFSGPGYLVAVGYMDPGNWATDIQGGSAFGYTLLSVILLSNVMAILLQALSARLGIATGRDLAQACREHYSRPVSIGLWILCEIAIAACDLAEVIGTAIALNLLFHLPLVWGVSFTALDVLVVLWLGHHGFRWLEILVVSVILLIGLCFGFEILFARPEAGPLLLGLIPNPAIVRQPAMLYAAIGIIGATVMPHNLYLHSSIVQTRKYDQSPLGRREAVRFASLDSFLALMFALLINGAILIVSAATFYTQGRHDVAAIQDAYRLLSPMLGAGLASVIFAVALLASGQNSTLTGTLAGQIVMEGFLDFRMRPWLRRLLTRLLAVVPAVIVAALYGMRGTDRLLILSQVVLSLQLPFAVIPLVLFTGNRRKMGDLVSAPWMQVLAWAVTALILALNLKLVLDYFGITGHPGS